MQKPSRRTVFAACVLALLFVGVLISIQRRDAATQRDGAPNWAAQREGSPVVETDVDLPSKTLNRYAITFEVETHTDAETVTTTEAVLVDRPFGSQVLARSPAGGTRTVSAFGKVSLRGSAFYVQPGAPDADLRPDAVLPEALKHGYAQKREAREVAGRDCRVFRMGDGDETDSLANLEDADTYTDVCVDADGLVLEQATFDGRDLVRRRIATKIDRSPRVDPDIFDLPEVEGDPVQVGSVRPLADDSRLPGDRFWELQDAPKGFKLRGRYAVIPPGQPGFTDIASNASVVTFVSEVWTDGPDVLVIDQGATRGATPFPVDPNARKVKGNSLGSGEMRYSLRESEVRFVLSDVRFVRVRGTLAPSRLLGVARDLRAVPGGALNLR